MTTQILRSLIFLTFLSSVLAAESKPPQAVPAVAPAAIAALLYALSGTVHWIQWFRHGRQPFMLLLPIGMTAMVVGFIVRILVHHSPTSLGLNIVTVLLILLSPCLFLALDYSILGRLSGTLGPEVSSKTMFITPTRVATIFVWADVGTFLVQALGGSMTTSSTKKTVDLGNNIVLIGLGIQLVSFALFVTLALVFGSRVRARFPEVWHVRGGAPFTAFGGHVADWRILYYTLCVTCGGILIRSIFRMAEGIQGHSGYISQHEAFFYCFDALPLWVSMTLYCVVWPPRFLTSPQDAQAMELKMNQGQGRMYVTGEGSYA
ncbi:RTA1 like protein-domain-containing protein [Mycena epipterygia]|nr:RTA1 like protein-domain-containing protein [Mycena epipterygia]